MRNSFVSMKKLNLILGLFLIFVIGSVASSCSKNDDEPKSSEVTLIGTWKCVGVESTNREELDYPYFIVQEDNCFFCKTSSVDSWGEKYKYVYDATNNVLKLQEWIDGSYISYVDVWSVPKLTANELWIKIEYRNEGSDEVIDTELFKFKKLSN